MADNKTATLTGSAGTTVDILITRQVEISMDKLLTILDIPKQTLPDSWLIDLNKLRTTITITGTLLDESTSSGKTKVDNIQTIMQGAGLCALQWGTGTPPEFSYSGNVVKLMIRQLPKRIPSGDATQGTRKDIFEIMLQFVVGTHRG